MLANLNRRGQLSDPAPGVDEPFVVNVKPDPDKNRMRPTIGVAPPETHDAVRRETDRSQTRRPPRRGAFKPGDKIVAIDGKPVATHADCWPS